MFITFIKQLKVITDKHLTKIIVIGFFIICILLVLGNMKLLQSQINKIFSIYSEFQTIDNKIEKYYPEFRRDYSALKNTVNTNGETQTTYRLTITLSSTKDLPPTDEYKRAGRLVCNILKNENKHYDIVTIRFQKQYGFLGFYPFNYSLGYNGSC